MLRVKSYQTAASILIGIEAMYVIKMGQSDLENKSVKNQKNFIYQVFDLIE